MALGTAMKITHKEVLEAFQGQGAYSTWQGNMQGTRKLFTKGRWRVPNSNRYFILSYHNGRITVFEEVANDAQTTWTPERIDEYIEVLQKMKRLAKTINE
jgi:hypothetical protein